MNESVPVAWNIEVGRVGPIELGKPLPDVLLARDLAASYTARYIADGQPLDGFRFDDPPLTLVIANGPFAALDATGHQGPPPVDTLREPGVAHARAGALVKAVMIHAAGPATQAGLGVGSTLADLEAGYGDVRLAPLPETLGGDLCVARSKANPGISFVFESCKKAKAGDPVKRVDLWIPEP